jgi:uncharacterized membrane protein YhhN
MALNIIIIVSGGILLPLLLYCEYRENRGSILPTKTALSTLFVITVLIQPHPIPTYYHLLLLGLLFCLGGDIFLALPQNRMFLLGLVSFLVGHIFYIIGFFSVAHINTWTWLGTLIVLVFSGYVYLGRVMVFSGASCFYVSDLFVARERFMKKAPINRFLGLPLYYTGQFLLAFSVGLL